MGTVKKRRVLLLAACAIAVGIVYLLLPPWFITSIDEGGVRAGRVISWRSALVHESPEYFVRAGGETFRDVRCRPPTHFVWLDNDHREVFFVTKTDYDNGTMYHVVEVQTGKERHVHAHGLFGNDLRSKPHPEEFFADYVDSYDGRLLRVVNSGRWLDTVNFETGELSSQEVKSGK